MNIEPEITKALDAGVQNLVGQMATKNLNDSGGTSKSIKVGEDNRTIVGSGVVYHLVYGRRPADANSKYSEQFGINLLAWVQRKLGLSGEDAVRAMWAVRSKINKEGTDIYSGKRTGIETAPLIDVVKTVVLENVKGAIITQIETIKKKENGTN